MRAAAEPRNWNYLIISVLISVLVLKNNILQFCFDFGTKDKCILILISENKGSGSVRNVKNIHTKYRIQHINYKYVYEQQMNPCIKVRI